MIGRLRMSVDQAIDNFIDFGNAVFGNPRVFRALIPRAKFSAINARDALLKIIRSNVENITGECSAGEFIAKNELFQDDGRRTRTLTISRGIDAGFTDETIWRSYYSHRGTTSLYTIWQVAYATTSANLVYASAIEIGPSKHYNGGVVTNPSSKILREVCFEHNKAPSTFVSLGTSRHVGAEVNPGDNAKRRNFPRKFRLQELNRSFRSHTAENITERQTEEWLELAERIGLNHAYRLNAGGLHEIPDDEWLPAATGSATIQFIKDVTNDYLRSNGVRDVINSIASEAVRIRRARAITGRWKDFTQDTEVRRCQDSEFKWNEKDRSWMKSS
ncbi:hypothetical protein H9Q69_007844 [Fusarium xylarioides]|nr:hypothetical protein H9Q69_007844 [Fusarium xylarioides]